MPATGIGIPLLSITGTGIINFVVGETELVTVQDSMDWGFLPGVSVTIHIIVKVTAVGGFLRFRVYEGVGLDYTTGVLLATFTDIVAVGEYHLTQTFAKPAGIKKMFLTADTDLAAAAEHGLQKIMEIV